MKQSTSSSTVACLRANYEMTDLEMEVAGILLELPQLILIRNRLPLPWPSWGAKRRRSAEQNSPVRRLRSASPAALPSSQETDAVVCPAFLPENLAAKVVEASSPATPLSFSPSESDEKPKRLKRKLSVMKRKEELLHIKKEFTQSNEVLRKEVERARSYLMNLEAEHLRLEARKQELILGTGKGKAQVIEPAITNRVEQRQPLIIDQTAKIERYEYPRRGVIDLNVSPPQTECGGRIWMEYNQQQFDDERIYSKAMAAQARHRRMLKCRDKNINGIAKLRLSHK